MSPAEGPLGVFDSGVGGLTVVGALLRRFPSERVLYVADQAHVPYGGRPLDEVRGFASAISRFLADQGCRAIVMACNISSATALDCVRACLAPRPVLGVIAPAAARAAALGPAPRIGVLATQGTVDSGAYLAQIRAHNPAAQVVQVPCPAFVPLVEAQRTDGPEAAVAAREYLAPLAEARCQAVVLGCTHYPFLLPALRAAAADLFDAPPAFVDPADEMADALRAALPDVGQVAGDGGIVLLTTGDAAAFRAQAPHFLPGTAFEVASVRWEGRTLHA